MATTTTTDLEQPTGHEPIVIAAGDDPADVVRLELRALARYGRHVALARAAVRRTPSDEDRREHFAAFVETLLAWCDDLEAVCDREGAALNAELAAHQNPPAMPDAKAIRLGALSRPVFDELLVAFNDAMRRAAPALTEHDAKELVEALRTRARTDHVGRVRARDASTAQFYGLAPIEITEWQAAYFAALTNERPPT